MTGPRVLLVGASGFIGSAIETHLVAAGMPVTRLVHDDPGRPGPHRVVRGDLSDPSSLRRACAGHDVVVNAASYVGSDLARQRRVNAVGSENLARAAERAGVSRLLYVSSTSVYGGHVANGSSERVAGFAPRSTLGASRLDAERATTAIGGVVLRPNLVYGRGDRFFLAPLLAAMHALDGWIEHGSARVSAISGDALGRLVAGMVTAPAESVGGGVFHAAHPRPVAIRELAGRVLVAAGRSAPRRSFGANEALDALGLAPVDASRIAMVAVDNWFDCRRAWAAAGATPGLRIGMSAAAQNWYISQLPAVP